MLNRILVPLDGSPRAEQALAVAEKLARATGGTLILIQALTLPIEYGTPFAPAVAPSSIEETERCAQAYLIRQASLPMLSGLAVETEVRTEAPALAILNVAVERQADLIVMTSHGRTGLAHWVFGSVAEHVARQATIPVLVLREHGLPFWTGEAKLIETPLETPQKPKQPGQPDSYPQLCVLVPLDGSILAEQALDPAARCAQALVSAMEQAKGGVSETISCLLHLVLVVRPYDALTENMPEALILTGAEDYLKQEADCLRAIYPQVMVTWEVTTGIDVADTLVAIVEGKQQSRGAQGQEVLRSSESDELAQIPGKYPEFTLLAMATHGRTGVMRWVWGSITERVVQKTTLPVLLVRPQLDHQLEQHFLHDVHFGVTAPKQPVAVGQAATGGWVEE